MLEEYIYKGTQKMRCGYTTGSCAAAAAKAASYALFAGAFQKTVTLATPKGITLNLEPENAVLKEDYAECSIRKDSGDDPDITNGILITATVRKCESGIMIDGGKGIGRVIHDGLDQPVGAAAINSVPRKMITEAVSSVCEQFDYRGGISVVISVPDGEEIAKKTYNPRMGIEGGISIIGTSGIVEPMSNTALIDTIRLEEKMRKTEGRKNLLLTLGNYSDDFLEKRLPHLLEKGVKCSNFIGEAIDAALENGFESVLIVGHIGKLVKLGAGIMNTHSAQADGRMDVLVSCALRAGTDISVLKNILTCVTVDEALALLYECGTAEETMRNLMERAQYYLNAKVKNTIPIGALMFSNKYGILGLTESAEEILKNMSEEYNG